MSLLTDMESDNSFWKELKAIQWSSCCLLCLHLSYNCLCSLALFNDLKRLGRNESRREQIYLYTRNSLTCFPLDVLGYRCVTSFLKSKPWLNYFISRESYIKSSFIFPFLHLTVDFLFWPCLDRICRKSQPVKMIHKNLCTSSSSVQGCLELYWTVSDF